VTFDVLIVGGGPVGLFLACELRLAGARPLVLEQRPEPDPADKARGLAGQVVRLLDHRGLFERCGGRKRCHRAAPALLRTPGPRAENTHMIAPLTAGSDVRYDMGEEHPAAPTGWFVPRAGDPRRPGGPD
jgi:2-polyprenyl-6-methoxyphenol hydroxylase-like FAD-dependent oxidoreductase